MRNKPTKRALLASALAVMLCVTMLVGATFAWFTDSTASAENIIKSGNLDVEMYWADGKEDPATTTWKDASSGAIFNYDKWEPGYTEVRHIKIANKGSLAFKYEVNIVPTGEVSDLADVIDVYYLDPAAQIANRTALTENNKLGTLTEVLANLSTTGSGTLLAGASDTITLALKMQESAGNEYQNKSIGTNFAVKLSAYQLTHENDSFDDQYDGITLVSDAAALKDAIAQDQNVILTDDIAVDVNDSIVIADDSEFLLDLNGHKISGTSSASGKNRALFTVKGEMNVIGEGTISMVHTGDNMVWGYLTAPFSVEAGVLTLGEGVNVMNFGGTDMAYAVDVNTTLGESTLNVDGAVLYSSYIGVRIFNNHSTAKGVVNYNSGIIQGAKNGYDIWAQLMSQPAENAVVNIADGISYTTEDKSGTMYYIESDTTLAATNGDLASALKNGGEVVLVNDIEVGATINVGANSVFDGNGHTITMGEFDNYHALFYLDKPGTVTIKNVVFDGIEKGAAVRTLNADLVLDNCTFINCAQSITQGIVRCNLGNATITNCKFIDNTCSMVVTFNWDAENDTALTVENCLFENNTCSDTAVIHYVDGTKCILNGNSFINNKVNVSGNNNTATVYLGFTENNVVTNNLFKGNIVKALESTKVRVTGGLMIGNKATITGNAFIDNYIENKNGTENLGKSVCASVYYSDIDLSGNYWGGGAPVENDDYFVEYPDENDVIINDYLTSYGD